MVSVALQCNVVVSIIGACPTCTDRMRIVRVILKLKHPRVFYSCLASNRRFSFAMLFHAFEDAQGLVDISLLKWTT